MKSKPDWAICLQKARQNKNLTQKQLAQIAGISKFTIIEYENGRRFPSFNTLLLICSVLNISAFELFDDQKEYLSSLDYEYRKLKNFINSSDDLHFQITDDYPLIDDSYYNENGDIVPDCYSSLDDCLIIEKTNPKKIFIVDKEKLLKKSYVIKQMLAKEYEHKLNKLLEDEMKNYLTKKKPD